MFSDPGKYILAARIIDENGEIITQTQSEVVRIAAPTPVPVVEIIAPSFDETALAPENLQVGTVALSGAGEPDSTLEFIVDRNSMATTTIDPEGNWTLETTFDEPGKYLVGLNSLDDSGNIVASAGSELITIPTPEPTDTPVPTDTPEPTSTPEPAAFSLPDDLSIGDLTLTGMGIPSTTVELLIDNSGMGTTTVDADGAWALDASFAEAGKYLVGLNSFDTDGNLIVASEPALITIPTAVPTAAPTPAPTPAPPSFELPNDLSD